MKISNKFPSYDYIIKNAGESLARFPLALISAAITTIAGILLIEENPNLPEHVLQKVAIVAALGLPFFFALAVLAEKKLWSKTNNFLMQAVGIVLLIIYYFTLPEDITEALINFNRFLLLYIGMHFLFAFIAFTGRDEINAFWQYNKTLFLRFLLAAIYSGVLYVGLTIALAAADHLFGFDIKEIRYPQLWFLMVGIFNTWIFIAGVPRDLNNLGNITDYPKGLKIFTQYILLPLVGLYFVILFAYEIKIIFTWNWPKGWVAHLVLWYAVVGILSMLLLYPQKDNEESRWIGRFVRWFYFSLIPLVPMLYFAILKRISEYGFTENRYFVLAMAVGLTVVVIYFIFSRRKDIRIIPIVLCGLAFLSSFGPWGAFSISRADQQARLNDLLVKDKIFVDGTIQKATEEISFEDQQEISSIIRYLSDFHGSDAFSVWFADSTLDSMSTTSRSIDIADLMGINLLYGWEMSGTGIYFNYSPDRKNALIIKNYDYLINFEISSTDSTDTTSAAYNLGDESYNLSILHDHPALKIKKQGADSSDTCETEIVLTDLLTELNKLIRDDRLPMDRYSFESRCGDTEVGVIFQNIAGYRTADKYNLNNLRGQFLIRKP